MKKLLIVLVVLGCAGVLLPVCAYYIWWNTEADGLQKVQAQIKADGLPTTVADLFPQIPPEDRNAAPLLKQAAGLVKTMSQDNVLIRCYPGNPTEKSNTARLPESRIVDVRRSLEEPASREIVRLLMEAATKDECFFGRDYSKGVFLELPELAPMMSAIRLLLNHSWVLAADGDVVGAANEIRAAMKISGFYRQDPILISWLVGTACEQMSLSGMMGLFETTNTQDLAVVEGLEQAVRESRSLARSSLARAFDGERVLFGGSIFEALRSRKITKAEMQALIGLSSPSAQGEWGMSGVLWLFQNPIRPLLLADEAAYLRFMLAAREGILDPELPNREPGKLSGQIPRSALLTRLSAPALEPAIRKAQEVETHLDLALLGLRAEEFRITNGHYPRTITEIPWEGGMPGDPYTGDHYHYAESDKNLLIYSVGPDFKDNQGNPRNEKGEKDIVWSVRHSSPDTQNP